MVGSALQNGCRTRRSVGFARSIHPSGWRMFDLRDPDDAQATIGSTPVWGELSGLNVH